MPRAGRNPTPKTRSDPSVGKGKTKRGRGGGLASWSQRPGRHGVFGVHIEGAAFTILTATGAPLCVRKIDIERDM